MLVDQRKRLKERRAETGGGQIAGPDVNRIRR